MEELYNCTWSQSRLTTASSTSQDTSAVVATGSGYVEPITDKSQLYQENLIGKEHDLVTKSIDAKPGDVITITTDSGSAYDGSYTVIQQSYYSDVIEASDAHTVVRMTK